MANTKPVVRVFETKGPKGLPMLRSADDERVAYLTPDGWLLLDDSGHSTTPMRAVAERFVAGEYGTLKKPFDPPKSIAFVVVPEPAAKPAEAKPARKRSKK
jgi:hypothetical protein